ncbi:MAG: NAD(+) synthase [Pseudomonadota bacterium]|nr:NAD(+) synthase [Pseudomonadota bacterium]
MTSRPSFKTKPPAATAANLYRHGMARLAVCSPKQTPGDPAANADQIIALAKKADKARAALALFSELGVSAYAIDDLLLQDALLARSIAEIDRIRAASEKLFPVLIVGAPLSVGPALYNCAVVIHRGRILGVVPKTYLPNYREYYEKRHFAHGDEAVERTVSLAGEDVPFGVDLIFRATDLPDFTFHVEICEDVWAAAPPSTFGAFAGATILCNLSASNITIGKAEERNILCDAQSRRCAAAYLYSGAGHGESTTDVTWDGHLAVFELGEKLAESRRFATDSAMIVADVDLDRLRLERLRTGTFRDAASRYRDKVVSFRTVEFDLKPPLTGAIPLERAVPRFPFVPDDPARLDQDCYEAYNIQVHGLMTRMQAAKINKCVIGVSGGLDSTQALLVATRAVDLMGLPRKNVIAVTMPGFATSDGTKANALALMKGLSVDARTLDIRPAAKQMLADLGHPYAKGKPVHDVTFENVQAGLRTDYLFRIANHEGGMVIGTGDLSESALGWQTYGVGDHMSHYNVNASVPKTLIQHLIRWCVSNGEYDKATAKTLLAILKTEISPELVPAGKDGAIQSTEEKIGPYALADFALYHLTRYGLKPSKIAFLAEHAWSDKTRGAWPANIDEADKVQYSRAEIRKWMKVFLHRFFAVSQFKRSATPNGPKISSGGALSPRGDWRAPSDGNARAWLDELDE